MYTVLHLLLLLYCAGIPIARMFLCNIAWSSWRAPHIHSSTSTIGDRLVLLTFKTDFLRILLLTVNFLFSQLPESSTLMSVKFAELYEFKKSFCRWFSDGFSAYISVLLPGRFEMHISLVLVSYTNEFLRHQINKMHPVAEIVFVKTSIYILSCKSEVILLASGWICAYWNYELLSRTKGIRRMASWMQRTAAEWDMHVRLAPRNKSWKKKSISASVWNKPVIQKLSWELNK